MTCRSTPYHEDSVGITTSQAFSLAPSLTFVRLPGPLVVWCDKISLLVSSPPVPEALS